MPLAQLLCAQWRQLPEMTFPVLPASIVPAAWPVLAAARGTGSGRMPRPHRLFAVADRHGYARAAFRQIFGPGMPSVRLGDRLDDGQAQPRRLESGAGSVDGAVVGPGQGLESVVDAGLGEPWPGVLYGQDQVPVPVAGRNEHLAIRRGVPDRVFYEVGQRLADPYRIYPDRAGVGPEPHLRSLAR